VPNDKRNHGNAKPEPTRDEVRSGLRPAGRPVANSGSGQRPAGRSANGPDANGSAPGPEPATSGSRRLYDYLHTPAPPLTETLDSFWSPRVPLEGLPEIPPPTSEPYEILRRLGPSPFDDSSFPLIGFFASAYERVSRFARERTRK
jgi:hypothetical protein